MYTIYHIPIEIAKNKIIKKRKKKRKKKEDQRTKKEKSLLLDYNNTKIFGRYYRKNRIHY